MVSIQQKNVFKKIEKKPKIGLNRDTMSLFKKIAFNGAVQIAGKIVSTLLGLVAIGILTRYLGAEKFGWYTTAITFLQFAGILIDFGLIPVTAQLLASGQHDETKLLQNLLGFRFATAFIFFGLTPFVAFLFPYPIEIKIAIALLSISFLAIAMNQIFTGYYQQTLAMHIPVIGELIGRIILVVGLGLGYYHHANFLTLMILISLSSIAYTASLWLATARRTKPTMTYDKAIWKSIAKTMWPIAISIVFNVVYLKGDTILLSLFRTQTEVGLYGAAYRVIDILAQIAMLMMGILLPLLAASFARKNIMEFKERYQNSFDAMMMIAIPITLGTFALADRIMLTVAVPEFASAGIMLRFLSLAVFGVYVGAVFGHTAVAIGQQKATMWIYISDAIITFVGYWYAIPRFGWYGAALLTIFSELYAGILLAWVISERIDCRLSLGRFAKIIGAGAVMLAPIFVFPQLNIFILIPIAVVIYVGVLIATKAVPRAVLGELMRRS